MKQIKFKSPARRLTVNHYSLFFILVLFGACSSLPPIHNAIFEKRTEEAHSLISKATPQEINQKDFFGQNPVHWAASYGDTKTLQLLLDKGADINFVDEASKIQTGPVYPQFRFTPLMRAAEAGNLDGVKFLVEKGAKLDLQSSFGFTALMVAVVNNHVPIAEYLLQKNATLTAIQADVLMRVNSCDYKDGEADYYYEHSVAGVMKHILPTHYRFYYCAKHPRIPTGGSYNFGFDYEGWGGLTGFSPNTTNNYIDGMENAESAEALDFLTSINPLTKISFQSIVTTAFNVIMKNRPTRQYEVSPCPCPTWAPWLKNKQCFIDNKSCTPQDQCQHCSKAK
jgi:Ankyrin repeats (3 copies)/Ankyrin repeats (many copies)